MLNLSGKFNSSTGQSSNNVRLVDVMFVLYKYVLCFYLKKNIVNIKYNDYKLEISFLYYWKKSKVYSAEILIFLKPCFFFRHDALRFLRLQCSCALLETSTQIKQKLMFENFEVPYRPIMLIILIFYNSVILFSVKTLNIQRPCK